MERQCSLIMFMSLSWTFWYEPLDGKAVESNYIMPSTQTFQFGPLDGKTEESNYFRSLTWTFWYKLPDGVMDILV